MMDSRDIIITPLFTEKYNSMNIGEKKTYIFKVHPSASRIQVKKAVEDIFNVRVEKVNTMNQRGKRKRLGRFEGRRPNWKKAVVYLEAGEKISAFEVV